MNSLSFIIALSAFSLALLALISALAGVILTLFITRRSLKKEKSNLYAAPRDAVTENPAKTLPATDSFSPHALLEATMNGMREGVIVVDEEMRVVASNRAAQEIFAENKGLTERRRLSEWTRDADIYEAFCAAIERGERAEIKVGAKSFRSGSAFELRVAPLHFGNDVKTRGAIGVFFDITRLEHLERVRQEFLSNVSHELRTPLTAILAFVETLEADAIDDAENNRRFLSIIGRNAARMHNLIDDILELSAIEAGMVEVEPQPVRLYALVEDVRQALAPRAEARKVALRNEVEPNVRVFADARRLEQMLTNLVDNAIKFNRQEGSVTISHERTEGRDHISVSDTGEGIPAEHLPRIFERFYRVDRARSREMGGTGLGLAIVKHLARAHGGEATVQSKPGAGTTFTIELPEEATRRHNKAATRR